MPIRYQIAQGCLYTVLFMSFALLRVGLPIMHWVLATLGLYLLLTGLAIYALIPLGSIWLINKINRDWPTLSLPPSPIFPQSDAVINLEDSQTVQRAVAVTYATKSSEPASIKKS